MLENFLNPSPHVDTAEALFIQVCRMIRVFASSSDNSAHTSLTQNIVNSQEINIAQIESQLHNWSIPHMKINTIYQQGNFKFNQNYSIKTKVKTISLNQNLEILQLLSQNTINHHRKKFKYIHIGLVQVAINLYLG